MARRGRAGVGLVASVALAALAALPAAAGVTILQSGVSPAPDYAGGRDTWISDEAYEQNRDNGRSATLRAGGKRHVLIRFDLSAIPKGEAVHRAVLRLADAGYPRPGPDGKSAGVLRAYAVTREWNDNANWLEHTRTNYKAADEGDWKTPGGEIDAETDFGQGQVEKGQVEKGLVASGALYAGAFGHIHELDVTEAVKRWQVGKLPNHGLLLRAAAQVSLASCEWPVAAYRPRLIVDHGPAAVGIEPLPPPPPKQIELNPISAAPDAGSPRGDYAAVRVGQNANCALRGASGSACIKENTAQFPGTWGWMTQCRIGGVAGDFSRTLLYFDLAGIPKDASIKEAKLICSLVTQTAGQVRNYRYGAFLVKFFDTNTDTDAAPPGWSADEAAAAERRSGQAWPGGSAVACTSDKPLAVGKVAQAEVERQGRKTKIDAAIEFDLTGAVRAWVAGKTPNCGVMLDNRIEGGSYDIHSARAFQPELRPYLEITLSPAVDAKPAPMEVKPAPPDGDYWVEPMRQVHRRFKGKPGTLSQYGDSITVTMAFLAPYSWGKKINAKNIAADAARDVEAVERHADLELWHKWKEGEYGNTGMMRSDWLFHNIDTWQRKMDAEAAVVMFGTNDIGSLWPPEYTENMAASLRRMMADGTVPMLTSIPPASRDGHREYWLAAISIAHGLKVPLIDYYAEIIRRRPDDWNGRLDKFAEFRKNEYEAPTLVSADGTHPSNPKAWQNDFSDEALGKNGYNLRNYMTIRMYGQIIRKVLRAEG